MAFDPVGIFHIKVYGHDEGLGWGVDDGWMRSMGKKGNCSRM